MNEATQVEVEDAANRTEFAFVVNGKLAVVPHQEVSWTELVAIAFPVWPSPDTMFTVTYRNAKGPKHEGILVEGGVVEVKKQGTIFDVTPTGKS